MVELRDIPAQLHTEEEIIELTDALNRECKDSGIQGLKFNVANKSDSLYILFKFIDIEGSMNKGGIKLEGTPYSTYTYLIKAITAGQEAIKQLNDMITAKRLENGSILSFKYRWGFGTESSISYWDYTHIQIRLSRKSLDILVGYTESGLDINDYLKGLKWEDNIVQFISDYNDYSLSRWINSELDTSDIEKLLIENMLNDKDVGGIILQNKASHSTQRLTSAYIINELGCFGAIVIWDIDYENKKVIKNILDDRVIDIENKRYVSDHSLFSRIEQRICGDTQTYVDMLS